MTCINTAWSFNDAEELQLILNQNGFTNAVLKDVKLIKHVKRSAPEAKFSFHHYDLENISKHAVIQIDITNNVELEEGSKMTQLFYKSVFNSYQNRKSPYAGETSTTLTCAMENQPTIREVSYYSSHSYVLLANASERNALGICDKELFKKKTIFFVGYNHKSKTFFNIRIFIPNANFNQKLYDDFAKQFGEANY
jgi:hypothetical protein